MNREQGVGCDPRELAAVPLTDGGEAVLDEVQFGQVRAKSIDSAPEPAEIAAEEPLETDMAAVALVEDGQQPSTGTDNRKVRWNRLAKYGVPLSVVGAIAAGALFVNEQRETPVQPRDEQPGVTATQTPGEAETEKPPSAEEIRIKEIQDKVAEERRLFPDVEPARPKHFWMVTGGDPKTNVVINANVKAVAPKQEAGGIVLEPGLTKDGLPDVDNVYWVNTTDQMNNGKSPHASGQPPAMLLGHTKRTPGNDGVFDTLQHAKKGDRAVIVDADGNKYHLVVTRKEIVPFAKFGELDGVADGKYYRRTIKAVSCFTTEDGNPQTENVVVTFEIVQITPKKTT
jgi:hypothetical protein